MDDNKKRLAEETTATELLQKSLNQTRKEKTELEQKVKELEARLAELEPPVGFDKFTWPDPDKAASCLKQPPCSTLKTH